MFSGSFSSFFSEVLTAIAFSLTPSVSRYSRTSSAWIWPLSRWSLPVRSTCTRQIGRIWRSTSALSRSASACRLLRHSRLSRRQSRQSSPPRTVTLIGSLTIPSRSNSLPRTSTSQLLNSGGSSLGRSLGVADSSSTNDGLKPYKVCKASLEYPLCPSSSTTTGRIRRRTLPSESLTMAP